jgi:hypothetical protein
MLMPAMTAIAVAVAGSLAFSAAGQAPAAGFANDSRTLWAWWWGRTYTGGYKVLWVRPGRSLSVTGRRLDGASRPLTADIPAGYSNTYQASGLYFPEPGCWQVDARASGQTLRFVVRVPSVYGRRVPVPI